MVKAIVTILEQVFVQNIFADKAIESMLKSNPIWGARDRAFIAETAYDIIRYYRLYQYCAHTKDDHWKIAGCYFILNEFEMTDWNEFVSLNPKDIISQHIVAQNNRQIRESIPDWLDDLGEKELSTSWEQELQALNKQAQVVLRTNTLKITKAELQEKLREENIETTESLVHSDALILNRRRNIFLSASFKKGFFEVQDASSQLVAPFLQVEPGMRVIDACAGAGGKTLHLAALMKNKGSLIALDMEKWKLDELKKRGRRNGVSIVETRWIDTTKVTKRLRETADRLLLDVPCSGLGVLRRNPDAKWKLNKTFIAKVIEQQKQILHNYSNMIKPTGKIVYSTCSILPSENKLQIQEFLNLHPEFQLEEEKNISPFESGFDGFYMARLSRKS